MMDQYLSIQIMKILTLNLIIEQLQTDAKPPHDAKRFNPHSLNPLLNHPKKSDDVWLGERAMIDSTRSG